MGQLKGGLVLAAVALGSWGAIGYAQMPVSTPAPNVDPVHSFSDAPHL